MICNSFWLDIQYSAKRRGIDFSISKEYAWDLYLQQNKKCALSKIDIFLDPEYTKNSGYNRSINTASLDRKDSSFGYIEDNVQWLHKEINFLKGKMTNEEVIKFSRKIYLEHLKEKRPSWPEYFIEMAYLVSTRSRDPSTKCGCVITDQNHRVISTGYNGSFQGIDDNIVSWERPDKYFHISHAEMNSLIFARESLKDCYAFITGIPCSNCCKHLLQAGICKIWYGNNRAKMTDLKDEEIVRKLCQLKQVKLIHVDI